MTSKNELEADKVVEIVEGTVEELKQEIKGAELDPFQLEKILEAEKKAKNRKTAKKFLEKKIENSYEDYTVDTRLSKDKIVELTNGTVKDLKEWVKKNDPGDEELQELLHYEKVAKNRKTAKKFLKDYSKKKELKENFEKAHYDFRQLEKDLNQLENQVKGTDVSLEDSMDEEIDEIAEEIQEEQGNEESDREPEENGEEKESAEDIDDKSEENETDEDQQEEDGEDEEKEDEEQKDPNETEEDEEKGTEEEDDNSDYEEGEETEEDEKSERQKKIELLAEMDADMTREEMEEISLEQLRQIKQEKEKRDELIEELSDQFDEEMLKKTSTSDLKKLKREINGDPEEDDSGESEQEKSDEEIEEEAQEDLEMLMGAVKDGEAEDEEDDNLESVENIKNFKEKISGIFSREVEEEEEGEGFNKDEVLDLLEDYRELEKYESMVKTAHIMKSYLEYEKNINREMTYKELAENVESENESLDRLLEFFKRMNMDQYTGNIRDDKDEVIDAAKETVEDIS